MLFRSKDLSTVRDKVMNTIRSVRDFIVDGLGPVSSILEKLKEKISGAIKAVKDSFGGFKKVDMSGPEEFHSKTSKIFGPISKLFEGLKSIFSAVWEGIKKLAPVDLCRSNFSRQGAYKYRNCCWVHHQKWRHVQIPGHY